MFQGFFHLEVSVNELEKIFRKIKLFSRQIRYINIRCHRKGASKGERQRNDP